MDEILSLLKRTRLLSGLFLVTAGITVIGLILAAFGLRTAGLLVVLVATQVLIAGGVVIHYRSLLLRTSGTGSPAAEAAPAGPRTEDIVAALRGELDSRSRHEQELTRLLREQRETTAQTRRARFADEFADFPSPRD
ncbi:hypothetical protein [Nesterenkonia marinintestina]|uniref:hypothetical protein n=1 Tax=Nesterenkonia marinintestina TaxID=2979865 RepID=UPI0021BFACAE|nr:hypothetical protein [Nesterenkonia sp. GX14115]